MKTIQFGSKTILETRRGILCERGRGALLNQIYGVFVYYK